MSVESKLGPAGHAFTITPSENSLSRPIRGLYVGGEGDVTVRMLSGAMVTFVGLIPGVIHPVQCTHITAATATDILGVV
jgi:hypothetical protein